MNSPPPTPATPALASGIPAGAPTANPPKRTRTHTDCTGEVAVVHNSIIKNYEPLKDDLTQSHVFEIPDCGPMEPLAANVALQLFVYYVADEKDRPLDKPRNLAKSVTVE